MNFSCTAGPGGAILSRDHLIMTQGEDRHRPNDRYCTGISWTQVLLGTADRQWHATGKVDRSLTTATTVGLTRSSEIHTRLPMAISLKCIEDEALTPRSGNHGVSERLTHREQDTVTDIKGVNRENTSSIRQIVYILLHP